jgi:hypothetical protein
MRRMRVLVGAFAVLPLFVASGVLVATRAAASTAPSVSITVDDAATSATWTNAETTGAQAYGSAAVQGDGTNPPTGSLTYTLHTASDCSDSGTALGSPALNPDGSVPDSPATVSLGAGTYYVQATYNGDTNYSSATSPCVSFKVMQATLTVGTTVHTGTGVTGASVTDSATLSTPVASFPATGTVTYTLFSGSCGTGTPHGAPDTETLSAGSVPDSTAFGPLGAGSYYFVATYSGDTNYVAAGPSTCEPFNLAMTPPTVSITVDDAATSATWTNAETTGAQAYGSAAVSGVASFGPTGQLTYTLYATTNCTGSATAERTVSVGGGPIANSNTTTPLAPGTYSFLAAYGGDGNYAASTACASFTVSQGTPEMPVIANAPPPTPDFGGSFVPTVTSNSDGLKSVTSSTPAVCTGGPTVNFVGVGTCTLVAHTGATANWAANDGNPQSFPVGRATPSAPAITNIPSGAGEFGSFDASIATSGDGVTFVSSNTPGICTVGPDGHTVSFVFFGTCSLTPAVAQGAHYLPAQGPPQIFGVYPARRGYWLVGSDGGIFSFGSAGFYGSMGGTRLQRPVVGITPTASRHGYWLVASDGGIFSFGDSTFYGSIPGLGLHPAASHLAPSLNAPIVGMVPTSTGHGYFMVASDGGVFAFGDARFEGSCPGIGGCSGSAVAVMPDHSGNGYWLVTNTGAIYNFGDAPSYGSPPPEVVPVTSAAATPDGRGYWVLYANGVVASFGDAPADGNPAGYVNGFNPASAVFPTADGQGYWIAAARGDVFSYGDAPFMGSMSAAGLNGSIIAGFGF